MSFFELTPVITADTPVNDSTLNMVAHTPTEYLTDVVEKDFIAKLTDKDMMRLAVLLAYKVILQDKL